MYYLPLNLRFYLKKTKKHKFKRRTTKISLAIKFIFGRLAELQTQQG
jgi:hypothetical protein